MVNMWCAHTPRLMKPMASVAAHHDGVAKDRLARENRNHLGEDRERRQHQDVDLGMAEDPEEVHPDDGRAAGLGVEEMPAQVAIEQQHDLRGGQRAR